MLRTPASTVFSLKRAELAIRSCLETALREVDLTPNQLLVLSLLDLRRATSSAELARAMGILPQSVTELVAPLERSGLLKRTPDAANRRILRIELTAAGRRLYARATEIAMRVEQDMLEGFTAAGIERLNRALQTLISNAERDRGAAPLDCTGGSKHK